MFRELEKKNALIEDMGRSNAFSVKSEVEFRPLKEDFVTKIAKLQSRVSELESLAKASEDALKATTNGVR